MNAPAGMPDASEAIRIEDLHKSFGTNEVLKGIDLTLDTHEVVCLIGASGSGKSTLLRCVNLLEPIDSGQISLWGQEITAARMVRVGRRPRSGPGTALFARPAGWRKAPQAVHPR